MSTLEPMLRLSQPLKLFAYHGRENGVMVVGSREAMQELAAQLQVALATPLTSAPANWPPELLGAEVQLGPYRGSQAYEFSLHVEGSAPAEAQVRLQPKGAPAYVVVPTLVLALVGLLSVFQWLTNRL